MDTHHSSGSPATPATTPSPTARSLHPLILSAAVAVVLFCGVGSAAIMGWLPNTRANDSVPMASDGSTGASGARPTTRPTAPRQANPGRGRALRRRRWQPHHAESQQMHGPLQPCE
jgi:hypothetical protein